MSRIPFKNPKRVEFNPKSHTSQFFPSEQTGGAKAADRQRGPASLVGSAADGVGKLPAARMMWPADPSSSAPRGASSAIHPRAAGMWPAEAGTILRSTLGGNSTRVDHVRPTDRRVHVVGVASDDVVDTSGQFSLELFMDACHVFPILTSAIHPAGEVGLERIVAFLGGRS